MAAAILLIEELTMIPRKTALNALTSLCLLASISVAQATYAAESSGESMESMEMDDSMMPGGMMGMGPMGMGMGMGMDQRGPMMGGGHGAMHGGGMNMMGMMSGMVQGLNLSAEQQTKVRALLRDMRHKHMALMTQRMDLDDELALAYSSSDKPDPAAIGEIYGKIFDLRKQMIQDAVTTKNAIYDVLTPEQRERYQGYAPMHGHSMMR
jgi:Spy/CpxP family protein refolding chaperone